MRLTYTLSVVHPNPDHDKLNEIRIIGANMLDENAVMA